MKRSKEILHKVLSEVIMIDDDDDDDATLSKVLDSCSVTEDEYI